jgi:hypothetical protein
MTQSYKKSYNLCLKSFVNFHPVLLYLLSFWISFFSLKNCDIEAWKDKPEADAIKKFTPSLGIPYLGV